MTARRMHWAWSAVALAALALLYAPMLAVGIYSVNASKYGATWRGFTLDWYRSVLARPEVMEAVGNTLVLALGSTAIATVLGTLLALALHRFPWPVWTRKPFQVLLYLPVVTPDIIFAAAMVVAFGVLRGLSSWFDPGLHTMILAHVTFQISFVAIVVGSRLATLGVAMEEAARDLYATGWYALRRVTLPLLLPGIVSGALLAFILSLDDFVISFFTAGPDSVTLPIFIYSSLRRGVTAEIHALSMLMFAATVVLVVAAQGVSRVLDRDKPRMKGAGT